MLPSRLISMLIFGPCHLADHHAQVIGVGNGLAVEARTRH